MAWFKVDDKLHSHKKAARAGVHAMGLWAITGSWCADQLTDGFVPDYIAHRFAPGDADDLADQLVRAGLWVKADHDGDSGWRFKDWDDYQPTRTEVEAKREKERDKKRNQRRSSTGCFESSQEVSPRDSEGSPEGVTPSRPDPTRPDPENQNQTSSRKRSDRATRLPEGWEPAPEPELVAAVGGDQAALRELARFRDYWAGVGGQKGRKVDWQATWRNWLRKNVDEKGGKPRSSLIGTGGVAS